MAQLKDTYVHGNLNVDGKLTVTEDKRNLVTIEGDNFIIGDEDLNPIFKGINYTVDASGDIDVKISIKKLEAQLQIKQVELILLKPKIKFLLNLIMVA